jgi:hypothetical protein
VKRRQWVVVGLLLLAAVLLGAAAFALGHRAGRGAMCFEVAVSSPDASGRTLSSTLLQLPGARSDYSFWGTHCTLSIGFPRNGGMVGWRWRFEPAEGKLWADSEEAEELFPASGRWKLPGTL